MNITIPALYGCQHQGTEKQNNPCLSRAPLQRAENGNIAEWWIFRYITLRYYEGYIKREVLQSTYVGMQDLKELERERWALTDSNRRPSACKADALNQLS